MKGKYLITTENWFIGKDGRSYRAVWGDVEILKDDVLGIKTNSRSTNWYAKVSTDTGSLIVAGCQIQYAMTCEEKPNTGDVVESEKVDGKWELATKNSTIYIP